MKRVFGKSFLLVAFISLFLSLNNVAFAECNTTGKPIGAECHFEDCECATDVCVNGLCVECATDSDCQDVQHCVENKCQ